MKTVNYIVLRVIKDGENYYRNYRIYKYSLSKNTKAVYEIKRNNAKCSTLLASPDPTGQKIATVAYCEPFSNESKAINKLIILDSKNNEEIVSLDNAGVFVFSPKGDVIAYCESAKNDEESDKPSFFIWLYDFNKKDKIKIKTTVPIWDINWSEHDGNIYVTDHRDVFRYNPRTGKGELVPYKGIYFSPDGKYYVSTGIEEPSHLYRTCDNKQMLEWEKIILAESKGEYARLDFKFWSKKLNAVVFRISNTENVVFDTGKGKVIGKFYGGVLGTNADGSLVAVNPVKADNKNAYDQTQVEIISLEEIVSKKIKD